MNPAENNVTWQSLRKKAEDATRPAPDGDYEIEVKDAVAKAASTSGNPMIAVTAKITTGPYAGKTVFNNFNFTPDSDFALAIFFRHMQAHGLGPTFFDAIPVGTTPEHFIPVAEALKNTRAVWTLSTRQWQGQDRNQVEAVKPVGGPGGPGVVPPIPTGPPSPTAGPPPLPVAASVPTPTEPPPPPVTQPTTPITPPPVQPTAAPPLPF